MWSEKANIGQTREAFERALEATNYLFKFNELGGFDFQFAEHTKVCQGVL